MYTTCSQLVFFLYWSQESMNNLSSYCGLTDSRMSNSEKDLPVCKTFHPKCLKITVVMLGYITFDSNGPKSYKWKRYSANTLVKKVVVGKEKGLFTKAVNTKYYVQWIILIYLNKYSLTSAVIEKIKLCFRHQKTFSY